MSPTSPTPNRSASPFLSVGADPAAPVLDIAAVCLGPWQTNCYALRPRGHPGCWIIDAGFEPQPLIDAVTSLGAKPELLILTHAHPDHIAGVAALRRAFPMLPVLIHRAESAWLADPALNLSALSGMDITAPGPDRTLDDADSLTLGPTTWTVLHTPGHSPGSISLHCPAAAVVFSGDALFAGSVGRTDFPASDWSTLERSIRSKLYTLPPATRVLPGHGPSTTISQERASNPFVSG